MKPILVLVLVLAVAMAACGTTQQPAASVSSSPVVITATLSATACDVVAPDHMSLSRVSFHLVNNTKVTGRFILGWVMPGHTFQDLVDWWNSPDGQTGPPDFTTEIGLLDVGSGNSRDMAVSIIHAGTYAFHCGYVNDKGTVTAFWHELKAADG